VRKEKKEKKDRGLDTIRKNEKKLCIVFIILETSLC
jgi:hypothetical protein